MEKNVRPLHEIAREIRNDWGSKMYFGAVPYFKAMETLTRIDQNYGCDTAKSIVMYFLSNATTWRGPVAREIKKELNAMIK